MSQLSSTEPIMSHEGIEPVIAHYQTLFDQVRKDATEQIRTNISSAVDSLFDVYVDYMKTITTKVCSTLKNVGQNCEEKYVPLALVESAVRVMQSNLRQLMDTEVEATSSKLSSLLKVPLCLPLKSNSHNHDDEDDDDDQQDSEDSQKIISELEKNLEDISDIDDGDEEEEEEEEEDGNEKSDKHKRNQQKRVTEHISREKIDQMFLLIRKLERVQIMEQAMLLRQLEKQKKKQQQQQSLASTSESHVTDYQTVPESRLTEPIGQQLSHSSATNSSISNSISSSSTAVADQSQMSVSPVPKSTHLHLVQTEPGTFKLVRQESNDAISHSTNVPGAVSLYILKPRPLPSTTDTTPNQSKIQSSNASNQLSNTLHLPSSSSPSEEMSFKSVALSDYQGQNDESDDDEVIFLKEVPSTRTNQVGSSIRDGDESQKSTQPVLEQVGRNVASIASVSCTSNLSHKRECNSIQNVVDMVLSMETNVSTVPSTSFPSTSNSFNNFGKRLLVRTSDESRPSKSPKSLVEPSSNANQSQDNANAITSQASTPTSGQHKSAKLDCPHCSDRSKLEPP